MQLRQRDAPAFGVGGLWDLGFMCMLCMCVCIYNGIYIYYHIYICTHIFSHVNLYKNVCVCEDVDIFRSGPSVFEVCPGFAGSKARGLQVSRWLIS